MKVLKGPRLNVRSVAEKKLNHLSLTKEGSLVKRSVPPRVTAVYCDCRTLRGERRREREREREPTKRPFLKGFHQLTFLSLEQRSH